MVCQLARPAETKARKAPVERPDAQIEPFHMAGANLVHIRVASNGFQFDAGASWLAVTVLKKCSLQNVFSIALAVNLLHDGKVETAKQVFADGRDIRTPAVTGDLNHAGDTRCQVLNEVVCVLIIPLARQVRNNQLCAPVNAKKREKVAALSVPFSCAALAYPNPRPKLVKLDGLGFDVADNRIVKAFGLRANDAHDFKHGVFITACQSCRCPDADAFRQAADDLDDFGFVQAQADEPALLVESFSASWIEATEALHGTGAGFETAEFFDFTAAA